MYNASTSPAARVRGGSAAPAGLAAAVKEHFVCPPGLLDVRVAEPRSAGFFRFGPAACFGACSLPDAPAAIEGDPMSLPDAAAAATAGRGFVNLPFDPGEVADNLRLERYVSACPRRSGLLLDARWVRRAFYLGRTFLPAAVRQRLQRMYLSDWRRLPFPAWPVDCSADLMLAEVLRLAILSRGGSPIPFIWFWPDGCAGCLMMTHDVDTPAGLEFCTKLMDLDESANVRSAFQIVPEGRYCVPPRLLEAIRRRGHEVAVHDLNHDGRLFESRDLFLSRAAKLREHARRFGAGGFRSGALYRNPEWYDALPFDYDMSAPNVAHLDPQRGGCCTVMPYFIGDVLELPLTTTQDYSLFHVLGEHSLRLWEDQIGAVVGHHGLLSFNIHPDYIRGDRARTVYAGLLSRLARITAAHNLWTALPREVNQWWRERARLQLVRCGGAWRISGDAGSRARLAYAAIESGRLVYRLI